MPATQKPMIALEQPGLTYGQLDLLARGKASLRLAASAETALAKGRRHIDEIRASGKRIYGITTGLGALSDVLLCVE